MRREAGLLVLAAGFLYGLWPPPVSARPLWLLAFVLFAVAALLWLRVPPSGGRRAAGSPPAGDPRSEWAVHIAHDFRTPLMRLRLRLSSLGAEGGLAPETLAAMEADVLQLEHLADGLIDLTAGKDAWLQEESRCDATDAAQRTADRLAPLFASQGRKLVCTAEDPALVSMGEEQVSRVLDNLLSNALRYSLGEGPVALSVGKDGPLFVRIDVSNPAAAPALPVEQLRAPFVRGDAPPSGEAMHEGFGLGLAVVDRLCAVAGGRVHVRYDDAARTFAVRVVLPTARAAR